MRVESRTVGPFQENSYLLVDEETNRAVLVDPGAEPDRLLSMVRASGATLEAIWLTHAHLDHIGGVAGVKRAFDVPVHLHPADLPIYQMGTASAAVYGVPFEQPDLPDAAFSDGDELKLGSLRFVVAHTPGHAPGHVIICGEGIMLGGDLLFAGSIGRTDLPLSDPVRMEESLARACTFGDDTVVYPGHGPATTIGVELASNPFLNGIARVVKR